MTYTTAALTTDTPEMHRARAILAPIDRDRLIIRLLDAGVSQAETADRLGTSQPTVSRVARRRDQVVTTAPSPLEIIARCVLGEITHDDMMKDLRGREYTAGHIPDGSYDGWVRGTWADIEMANATGLLSDRDLQALLPLAPPSS